MSKLLDENFVLDSIAINYRTILRERIKERVKKVLEEELNSVVEEMIDQCIKAFEIHGYDDYKTMGRIINVNVRKA